MSQLPIKEQQSVEIEDILDLLEKWLLSEPTVRGHSIADAELRLRCNGDGRLALWLNSKNPEAEVRALGECLLERLNEAKCEACGQALKPPRLPPDFPESAFADFSSLEELQLILHGKAGDFYFTDEAKHDSDPLRR